MQLPASARSGGPLLHRIRALMAGEDVGAALQRAKWAILRRYRNPLGLLYTMYGNTRLRIRAEL